MPSIFPALCRFLVRVPPAEATSCRAVRFGPRMKSDYQPAHAPHRLPPDGKKLA